MKNLTLLFVAILSLNYCSAQNYYIAWDGYGVATRHNHSVTYGYGTYQYTAIADGLGFGFLEINQQYDLFYDDERGRTVGSDVSLKLNYYFLSPMFVFQLGKSGKVQCYVSGGLGYAQGGTSTLHKWSNKPWSSAGEVYDSIIDQSASINTLVYRFGGGFTEFCPLGGNFHLFFNQDVGFTSSMLDFREQNNTHLATNASQLFRPMFFSLRVGIAFITNSRYKNMPYRIRTRGGEY